MSEKKNYIKGFYKEVPTQYGSLFNLSINLESIQELPIDKYGNVKVTLMKLKTPDKNNNTHCLVENTYVPIKEQEAEKRAKDDLPF